MLKTVAAVLFATFFFGSYADACQLLQQWRERIVEMRRESPEEDRCFVDLQSRVMWFNQEETPVTRIEIFEAPRRGSIKIYSSRYVSYFHHGWQQGEDRFVVRFYLGERLQQITVIVRMSAGQI
jgi:hypothetical protein